ncbi:MAG: HEAT repeat domain-containing protein [Actinobacteria bacterium]|nr:HEAT repeat domain-containing protein [Actinomycetota bacterium]
MTKDSKLTAQARRRRAVAVGGHLGDEASVRAALADDAAGVRATALGALARMGRLTDDDVCAALADPDQVVRRRACELAATHPDVDLLPLLADRDTAVVETAAWALGEQAGDDDTTVDALAVVATAHDDPLCREAAVAALGALGSPRGLPAILAAIDDKPAVRRRAVLALAPFDGPEIDATLRRALEDRDWQVRQAAEDLLRD